MTINSLFNGLTQNLIFGGVGAMIILALMFNKANKVAASGNKAKMVGWSVAPALMVIIAVIAHGVAVGVVWPRLQGAFSSTPVQNALSLGDGLTQLADTVLFGNGGDGTLNASVATAGAAAFKAPVVVESNNAPLVNDGQVASFVEQPANVADNMERKIETPAQAIAAFSALEPTVEPMTYINQFVADNSPVDTDIACSGSYTVKRGDSLAKIAKACYGDSNKWRAICDANRNVIRDCNNIRTGTVLVIPASSGSSPTSAVVNGQVPASFGQQTTTYTARPTPVPVYTQRGQQQAGLQRDLATGDTVISSNADAVQAVQALGPLPTSAPVAVAPTATPRSVTTYAELKAQQGGVPGGGQAYIDQFLKTHNNTTVADAGK